MKITTFKVWLIRFLFCVLVIAAYKTFDDFSGIVRGVHTLLGILTPIIIGAIFSFFLFAPARKLESLLRRSHKKFLHHNSRPLSVLVVILLFLGVLALFFSLFIPLFYQKIAAFVSAVPLYINKLYQLLHSYFGDVAWLDQASQTIQNFFTFENITQNIDLVGYASKITGLFSFLFQLIVGFILSIYFLLERGRISKTFLRIGKLVMKKSRTQRIAHLLGRISRVIYSFVYGQALDALLIGCIVGVVLALFHIPNAFILGTIYFLFALIPYFGPFIGIACITLFTFLSAGAQPCIIALIITLVLQQIDGNFLYPRVIGNVVGIRPLYVILGVTIFGGLFGIVGLFLGPPLMSIITELSDEFMHNKEEHLQLNAPKTAAAKEPAPSTTSKGDPPDAG